jgi:hypothetical protein
MKFAATLPDNCPLPSAVECACEVYMVVRGDPVSAEDCLSQADKGKYASATGDAACTRHGLSVFPDLESCIHHQALFKGYLGDRIAKATLDSSHGVIDHTASKKAPAHHTWWSCEGVTRHSLFAVVHEVAP